jgi:hypothetical protein
VYLKDVNEICDDGRDKRLFSVSSPARCLNLEAPGEIERNAWLQTLVDNCPFASTSKIHGTVSWN